MNYIGEGPQSSSITIVAAAAPDAPAAPTRTGSTLTTISIQWSAPHNGGSAIINYKIFMNGFTGSTTFTEIETVSSTTFTYTKFSLTTGQSYKFKVLAVNVVG